MNEKIAKILLGKLSGQVWADKFAGLVRPITFTLDTKKQTLPIACGVSLKECKDKGLYRDLTPNSNYKSVMYFEDLGSRMIGGNCNEAEMQSTLKLVVWLNGCKLGYNGCELSTAVSIDIMKQLNSIRTLNEDGLTKIKITGISEDVKSPQIFGKYTYNESSTQYLMFPHDYLAMTIQVQYTVPFNCLSEFTLNPENICC